MADELLTNLFNQDIEWLDILPQWQKEMIDQMLTQGKTYEEVATIWLDSGTASNTYPFGSDNKRSLFFEKVLKEIESFICRDDTYIEERRAILDKFKAGETLVVSSLATAIATTVGAVPALILPAVVLILKMIGKIGTKAWCSLREDLNSQTDI
ncbi:hypothetical protein [Paenibacillus sp. USHLN196]|uniref:hypothetical protein n=1 Tax=Paenibacillus sp. USHLN196 TaxID=3081291 RepID=UPI0030199D36